MTALWEVPVVVAALVAWLSAPPLSIGDAAERERLRRQLTIRSVAAYTNFDLPGLGRVDSLARQEAGRQDVQDRQEPPREGTEPTPPPVEGAAGEKWWRSRAAALRESIERGELLAGAMQTRINGLTTDVVSRDDPFQREALREQLQRAIAEHDRLQALVIDGRRGLEALQTEARRRGVPAGWLR